MNQKEEDDLFLTGSFTWRIEHFSKLKDWHYSQSFPIGGIKWRILIGPKGKDFSMYLGVADASTLPPGWTKCAHFSLAVVNQLDAKKAIAKPAIGTAQQMFKKKEAEWGFGSFMPCSQFYDCSAGYLVDDVCILEAKVEIPVTCEDEETGIAATMESSVKRELIEWEPSNMNSKLAPEIVVAPKTPCSEVVPNFQDTPGSGKGLKIKILKKDLSYARKTENEVSPFTQKKEKEVLPASSDERVDFKGFGLIEKAFIPLLEDVCSQHPSLILSQMNNSKMIAKCAFRALGRLLHFLKTAKVKDMTEEGCERLRILYKELEIFGFELAWLEPQVQSAFGMNKLVQRTGRRKRLREDVDVLAKEVKKRKNDINAMESEVKRLEIELQRRRATLAVAEDDLEVMKGDLAKVEEDFNGVDMDNELGYKKY